ncbi:MAG: hypothetical protein ACRD8O_22190 [Bryobacteraceae bacterium]
MPVTGSGTAADPKRPLIAPTRTPSNGRGILGFTMRLSDNSQFALCEFVARDRAAFQSILTAARPDVIVFEKGKATRTAIETEFRRFKANFNLDKMGVALP